MMIPFFHRRPRGHRRSGPHSLLQDTGAMAARLPLDVLKIDRSFVQDIEHDVDDANIVATITAIAQNMGLSLIAEGVENAAQRDFLVQHGCERFQGHLYHPAMPVPDFEALLEDRQGMRSEMDSDHGGSRE